MARPLGEHIFRTTYLLPLFTKCVEGEFCELRELCILGSSVFAFASSPVRNRFSSPNELAQDGTFARCLLVAASLGF